MTAAATIAAAITNNNAPSLHVIDNLYRKDHFMTYQLIVAWIASSLAGAVTGVATHQGVMTLLGGPAGLSTGTVRVFIFMLAVALVIQLIYGGALYAVLRPLGMFKLPLVLLAYLGPAIWLVWSGSDVPKDFIMVAPRVSGVAALAVVGWYLASP